MISSTCRILPQPSTRGCRSQTVRPSSHPLRPCPATAPPLWKRPGLTDQRMELDEDARAALDSKQQLLLERIKERPEITVTWFQPDAKKDGGRYIVSTGRLKRIHEADQVLILVDGLRIPIGDIVELESECIRGLL